MNALSAIADVRAGHAFRGKIPAYEAGDTRVVQIKNLINGRRVDWQGTVRTRLDGRREPDWLRKNDVLFVARGGNNVAVHIPDVPCPAVCAPQFFVIRLKPGTPMLPAFLAWQINAAPARRYIEKSAEGSLHPSIRRGVLEDMPIAMPSLERQTAIVALAEGADREAALLRKMIDNDRTMLDVVARDLWTC